jgi:hypothetical protein
MNKNRLFKILPIVVTIFLFAVSPLAFTRTSAVSSSQAKVSLQDVVPPYASHLVANTVNYPSIKPAAFSCAASTVHCTVIADSSLGAVQVFKDGATPILEASMFVPLTAADPDSCPFAVINDPAISAWLISDPCGNSGAGELRVLTYSLIWGTPWTNVGCDPRLGIISGSDVFIGNFACSTGTVTVVTTTDTTVASIATCGYSPLFMAEDTSGNVYVQDFGVDPNTGNYASCIDRMTASGITATLWGDSGSNSPEAAYGSSGAYTAGIAVSGSNIAVDCLYCSQSNGNEGAVFFTSTSLSTWASTNDAVPNSYGLYGMASQTTSSNTALVYPISQYDDSSLGFSNIGFTVAVNPSTETVSSTELNLGAVPAYACTSGHSTLAKPVYEFPNTQGGSSYNYQSILTQLTPPGTLKNVNYVGEVDGLGCGSK